MANSVPEDGVPETGIETGGATETPQYDRRRFFQTLGAGAGAATVYGLGTNEADGAIVAEAGDAREDDVYLIEEEPHADLSDEQFAKQLDTEMERDAVLVAQLLQADQAKLGEHIESLSVEDRTALFAALPFLVMAPQEGEAEENVAQEQGVSRRGLLAAGVAGIAAMGLGASEAQGGKKSLIRTVAANNTSGRRTETRRQTPAERYEVDLRAKLDALKANSELITNTEVALTYHDFDDSRRDYETPDRARTRRGGALADFNLIQNKQRSTRMVEVDGQQVQLPTRHTQVQRKQERRVKVGDRTVMGKMNYIVSDTRLLRDANNNPIGLKIAKPLSINSNTAARRYTAYRGRY
jgi:hypothetical protein